MRAPALVLAPLAVLAALGALSTAACGRPLLKLPMGPGVTIDVARATAAMNEATSICVAVRPLTAEVGVSGSTAGRRLRGRLLIGVAAPASVRIEALAPAGPPLFFFVATGGRVLHHFAHDRANHMEPRGEVQCSWVSPQWRSTNSSNGWPGDGRTSSGSYCMAVGRIASCASCAAFFAPNTFGFSGT